MKINFKLIGNHSIKLEEHEIDLRDDFELEYFHYDVLRKEIRLHWKKAEGSWVKSKEISRLTILHKDVCFFSAEGQDEMSDIQSDSQLSELTFFPASLREMNESISPQEQPHKGDDILYFFENGQLIKIHCKEIEAQIKIDSKAPSSQFSGNVLKEEDAFWVMWYFLNEHYELAEGQFDLADILSASQPFEFDEKGHFDGKVEGNRPVAPADSSMVAYWNEAIEKFKKQGVPPLTPLKK